MDIAQYSNACAIVQNFLLRPYGSVISAPGTEFINDSKYESLGGNDSNTILLAHFDDDPGFLVDSAIGGSGNTLSVNGLVASTDGYFDEGALFTRSAAAKSANYLSITPVSLADYNSSFTSSWTLDFRINFNSFPVETGSSGIFYLLRMVGDVSQGPGTNNHYFFFMRLDGGMRFDFQTSAASGTSAQVTSTTMTLSTATDYHLAYVKSGATIRLFVNGVLDFSTTIANNVSPGALASEFWVGKGNNDTEADEFDGVLDELRWSNIPRWTANFTPSEHAYADPSDPSVNRFYGKSRLIPFIFARNDAYVIEVGESYFRFYTDGAVVTS